MDSGLPRSHRWSLDVANSVLGLGIRLHGFRLVDSIATSPSKDHTLRPSYLLCPHALHGLSCSPPIKTLIHGWNVSFIRLQVHALIEEPPKTSTICPVARRQGNNVSRWIQMTNREVRLTIEHPGRKVGSRLTDLHGRGFITWIPAS